MAEEMRDEGKDTEEQSGPLLRFTREVKIGADTTDRDYLNVPIGNFGKSMLEKMGWAEGKGVGRNAGLVQPIEFIPRHHRLGLGGTPIPTMKIKGGLKAVTTDREKGELHSSNYKYLDEKIKSKSTPGTEVIINHGKYEGMYGRVLGLDEGSDKTLCVELSANDQKIKVLKDYVSIVKAEEKKEKKSPPREKHRRKKEKLNWVLPGILVRVISKDYAGGKYYNKKLGVEDVPDKRNFTLITESGNFLDDLTEDDIETVMPQLMEDVLILKGRNKGEVGKLMMRDKKKNAVKIQLYDRPDTVLDYTQDDCCALYNKKLYD